jgi:signal transduction histidine kinase/DNA-binding NarL/FixJ family response regulator
MERECQLKATIKRISQGGLVVEVEGKEGFVPRRELSWEDPNMNPIEVYNVGEELDVVQYESVEFGKSRFSVKRAVYDPWARSRERYSNQVKRGDFPVARGVVRDLTPSRVYVELEDHNNAVVLRSAIFEGLQIPDKEQDLTHWLSLGDHIEGRIKNVLDDEKLLLPDIAGHVQRLALDYRQKKEAADSKSWAGTYGTHFPKLLSVSIVEQHEHRTVPKHMASLRVLAVEDDELDRNRLREILTDLGCAKELPESHEAFNLILKEGRYFDLLIMDKNLDNWDKGLKGSELVLPIRQYHPGIPIIAFSREDLDGIKRAFKNINHVWYHTKPYTRPVIESILENQVDAISGSSLDEIRRINQSVRVTRKFLSSDAGIEDRLNRLLTILCGKSEGLGAAILHMNRVDREVGCLCSSGLGNIPWSDHKSTLRHTPITNVIVDDEPLFWRQLPENRRRHFPSQLVFTAFAGLPIETFGRTSHGLFLFGSGNDSITVQIYATANDLVFLIARLLERASMDRALADEALFASMGRLYSTMGHEIRDAVIAIRKVPTILRKYLEGLKTTHEPSAGESSIDAIASGLKVLEDSGKHILELFDFYADLSPRNTPQSAPLFVRDVANSVVGEMQKSGLFPETQFQVDVDESLLVSSSRIKLVQILKNLILNACQQMAEFKPPAQYVCVSAHMDQETDELPLKISVRDSGCGIHARDWERIFEPFHSTREDGAGLGLYLCRLLARSMRGRIRVQESYRFVGTTFLLELPSESGGQGDLTGDIS